MCYFLTHERVVSEPSGKGSGSVIKLLENADNTFITPVFNGSASLRMAAGEMIEQVVDALIAKPKKTVDDAFIDKLKLCSARIGTEKMLVCSSAVIEGQVESINTFIAKSCAENSEFIGLAAMHPKFENYCDELERSKKMGLVGVKFHPDFQKFNIDDESVEKFYRAASGKLPILFHIGDDRYDFSKPGRLVKMAKKYPETTFIAAPKNC